MRGEHKDRDDMEYLTTGSSPHARGTLTPLRAEALRCRIIPACAGNTTIRPTDAL